MSEVPLGAGEIRRYLREVADLLPADTPRRTLIVVGGSLLALHELRQTTLDVDTVRRLDEDLRAAVATVGLEHSLAPKWLNDHSAAFAPATLREEDCDILLDLPRLLVLGAPLRQVFMMKLYASRTRDVEDLISLWPRCEFSNAEEVVLLLAEAYPHQEADPFLAEFVSDIARRSRS